MKKEILFWLFAYLLCVGVVNAQPCQSLHKPIVLIHGFLGSGDNYAPLVRQFKQAGYCPDRFFAYDWNSIARQGQTTLLDAFIDSILRLTGAEKVDLIGHSAGGSVAYAYLNDSIRQQKVAHYVHIGSGAQKQAAGISGSVPTLNLYSKSDRVVKSGDISGATNQSFFTYDHFEVVTADSSIQAVYAFFNEGKILKPHIQPSAKMAFSAKGKVVTLGENSLQSGAKVAWQAVDKSGRAKGREHETLTDKQGGFVMDGLQPNTGYLVSCTPVSGRKVVYFFPKIEVGESLLYLRTLPSSGMVSALLGGLPTGNEEVALVVFSSQQAVIHGRDQLSVNQLVLSTSELAKPEKTAIAWFLYDANKNGKTDGSAIAAFNTTPFLRGVDLKTEAGAAKTVSMVWNGKSLVFPAIPASEAVTIVVL